ncbi:MAG: hypothetical protein JXD22_11965 [Sedimentisphaerales bacterium]|nr:hypothetical protein [Sedimentisphaerales bacterium]
MSGKHKEASKTTMSGSGTLSVAGQVRKVRGRELKTIIKGPVRTGFVVLVLSGLIWVFAERSVVEELTVTVKIPLDVSPQDIRLQYFDLVSREVQEGKFYLVTLEVKGPRARIQRLAEKNLTPIIVPLGVQQLMDEPSEDFEVRDFTVSVMDILEGKLHFKEIEGYLQVIQAKPSKLGVRAQKLREALLKVQVFDASGSRELELESIEPETVKAWMEPGGVIVPVKIPLSRELQRKAESEPITVSAAIPNRPEKMDFKIKLAANSGAVSVDKIAKEDIRFAIAMPPEWSGQYAVKIEGADFLDGYAPIEFRGSTPARDEFRRQTYHLVLEVKQEDLKNKGGTRLLRYLRPEGLTDFEFVSPKLKAVSFRITPLGKDESKQE